MLFYDNKIQSDKAKNRAIYIILFLLGAAVSFWTVKNSILITPLWDIPVEEHYMSLRIEWLQMFIDEVGRSGLYTGLHRLYDHNATMYLYLSHIGNILGKNAVGTIHYVQVALTCICFAIYPVLIYRLTHSIPAAVMSVFFFKIYTPYSLYLVNDCYYILSWAVFMSMPVLFILYREKIDIKKRGWFIYLFAVTAVGNVFRSGGTLFIVINIIIIMAVKVIVPSIKNRNNRAVIMAVLVCFTALYSKNILTDTVPKIYQSVTNQPKMLPVKGPWHSMYIGLGWEENPDGIEFYDNFAYTGNEKFLYDITEGYYIGIESPEYINKIKGDYFDTVFKNFRFYFSSYVRKGFTAVKTVFENSVVNPKNLLNGNYYGTHRLRFLLYFIMPVSIAAYTVKSKKGKHLKDIFIMAATCFVFAFALGIVPGMMGFPYSREHMFNAVAALDYILFFEYIIFSDIVFCTIKAMLSKKR